MKGLLTFYKYLGMSLHTDETDEENGYKSYKVRSVLETFSEKSNSEISDYIIVIGERQTI